MFWMRGFQNRARFRVPVFGPFKLILQGDVLPLGFSSTDGASIQSAK